jgi:hypothetical protein
MFHTFQIQKWENNKYKMYFNSGLVMFQEKYFETTLVFEIGPEQNLEWGCNPPDCPPSMSHSNVN